MSEHKRNPVAIAAKKGELPPKKKKMGKRESERMIYSEVERRLLNPFMEVIKNEGKF